MNNLKSINPDTLNQYLEVIILMNKVRNNNPVFYIKLNHERSMLHDKLLKEVNTTRDDTNFEALIANYIEEFIYIMENSCA